MRKSVTAIARGQRISAILINSIPHRQQGRIFGNRAAWYQRPSENGTVLHCSLMTSAIFRPTVLLAHIRTVQTLRERHWDLLYLDHDLGDFSGVEGRELTGYFAGPNGDRDQQPSRQTED